MKRNKTNGRATAAGPKSLEDNDLDRIAAGAKEEMLEFPGAQDDGLKAQLAKIQSPSPDDSKLEPKKENFGGNAAEGSSHV
ncbi:MAG: hypothetical protein KDJ47_13940 [Hyphomicrobiaceae bacterium]|nr:hypothetical protein [Hyphomicrobiaceae bacterium]